MSRISIVEHLDSVHERLVPSAGATVRHGGGVALVDVAAVRAATIGRGVQR
jgi:hypothetical protein